MISECDISKYRITGLNWLLWRWFSCDLKGFNKACNYNGVYTVREALNWVKKGKLGGNLYYKKQFIKAYSDFICDFFPSDEN